MSYRIQTTTTPGTNWVKCHKVPDYIDQWVAIKTWEKLREEEDRKCRLDPNHTRNHYTIDWISYLEAELNGAEVPYQLSNELVIELE
jgi:hypothetical protein